MLNPPDIPQLAEDPNQGFLAWINAPFEPGIGEQRSLEAFAQHFLSFWNYRHLGNFHFFHYSDMKKELQETVERISKILKLEVSKERVDEICDAVGFDQMKKNASAFAPASGKPLFKSDEGFFSSGKNEQWRGVLGADEIANYTSRINGLLPRLAVEWLENDKA